MPALTPSTLTSAVSASAVRSATAAVAATAATTAAAAAAASGGASRDAAASLPMPPPRFVTRAAESLFPGPPSAQAVARMRASWPPVAVASSPAPPCTAAAAAPMPSSLPAAPTAARGLWDPALAEALFRPRTADGRGGLGLVLSPAVALKHQGAPIGLGLEVALTDRNANQRAGLAADATFVPAGMPLMAVPMSAVKRCRGRDEAEAMQRTMRWLRSCSEQAAFDGSAAQGWDAVARSYRARFEGNHEALASNGATDWASYVARSRCHHFSTPAALAAAKLCQVRAGCSAKGTPPPHNDDAAGLAEDVAAAAEGGDLAATVTLVPGVDFVNHAANPTAQMHRLSSAQGHLSLWANWVAGAHVAHLEEPHIFLVALRDIEHGEEVTITYADFDPATDSRAWRTHVGFVPQEPTRVLQRDAEALAAASFERYLLAKAPSPSAEAM